MKIVKWDEIDWISNETVMVERNGGIEFIKPQQRLATDMAIKRELAPLNKQIANEWATRNPFVRELRKGRL